MGTCNALFYLTHDLQLTLDKGFETRIVSLEFSSAFESVNHAGLLFKLQSIGVGGVLLSILKQFLSNRQQRVVFALHWGSESTYNDDNNKSDFIFY